MIFTLGFFLGVMVAAAPAQPMESQARTQSLDMMEMVKVNETLAVYKRKHTQETPLQCQSAKKVHKESDTKYQYNLRARLGSSGSYNSENVEVTLVPKPEGGYKSTYTQGEIQYTLTLEKMDQNGHCFVILAEKSSGISGCELLLPVSQLTSPIPEVCNEYYNTKCEGRSIDLYKADCKYE
uniref:Secreted protein n=1 Tax=Amblyomma parvum TaxID=251391 RepID=A0A023FYY2_AMBPA